MSLQTLGCITVFGMAAWQALLKLTPAWSMPAFACKGAGLPEGATCNLDAFLTAGRAKAMHKFEQQHRMLPAALLGAGQSRIAVATLTEKYCAVMNICGEKSHFSGAYANSDKYAEMAAAAARAVTAYDTDGDNQLSLEELGAAVGSSDGKLSLASIDPGTGGALSVGALWNGFIAALVLFFVYSIVEQGAISTQAAEDAEEVASLQKAAVGTTRSSRKGKAKSD